MNTNYVKQVLRALRFHSSTKGAYTNTWPEHDGYSITVDLSKGKIVYPMPIKVEDSTTSNLEQDENLVVLECVCRLLTKGYKPASLTLEQKWRLGRTSKGGKADITVAGMDGKTLLIIECKTWASEYQKERKRMASDGGQLFSYLQQDQNARYICLYSSRVLRGRVEIEYGLVRVDDTPEEIREQRDSDAILTYQGANNVRELVNVWDLKSQKKFLEKGLFEDEIEPYNPGFRPRKISDLKNFEEGDKGAVFGEFEEILRHNNISDRSNAFNRVISLILAKIVDEGKDDYEIADFQVKDGVDDAESLHERLQTLYSKAMREYLDEEVVDYRLEDIELQIANFPRQAAKDTLFRMFKELKFYQNNEFALKEVYNKKLFEENSIVLQEVVRLFQNFRFKYDRKAQFLGDFFELMLESGYKQSEGQFFTPTPIAKFIVSSIPFVDLVKARIKDERRMLLPKVIDFACGSGHFLTEAMDEISSLIESSADADDEMISVRSKLAGYRGDMSWARECIFGVEKDYRLARTSQVACFMHGDGDANIIFGDGLENHERLGKSGTFDVLVANPPYTIKYFRNHISVGADDFELWQYLTDDSDDIEVLFVERMKQLLRVGGFAGIILPTSIISSLGVHTKVRQLLLKHFEIKGLVELGNKAFSATGTKTVVLFLRRRDPDFLANCQYVAEDFIRQIDRRENDFFDSRYAYETYVNQLGIDLRNYERLLTGKFTKELTSTSFYETYRDWFESLVEVRKLRATKRFKKLDKKKQDERLNGLFREKVVNNEEEKFFYFLLTFSDALGSADDHVGTSRRAGKNGRKSMRPQRTLVCRTMDENKRKQFLGYTFSNRRGYKGIRIGHECLMFDNWKRLNPRKVNTHIYRHLQEKSIDIEPELSDMLRLVNLRDCIDFQKLDMDLKINMGARPAFYDGRFGKPLKGIAEITKGSTITERETQPGSIPVVAGGQQPAYFHNKHNREGNVITVSASGQNAGYLNYWEERIFASDCITIRSLDESVISTKLIYRYLKSMQKEIHQLQTGQAQPHVYVTDMEPVSIPVLDPEVQARIVARIERIEQQQEEMQNSMLSLRKEIKRLFTEIGGELKELSKLTSMIGTGATPRGGESSYKMQGIALIRSKNVHDEGMRGHELVFIDDSQAEKLRRVEVMQEDILFNVTGASVARCCPVEEEYLPARVNQHVAIIRTNERVHHKFLHQVLISRGVKAQLHELANKGTTREAINKEDLELFRVPWVQTKKQVILVEQLESLQKSIKAFEEQIDQLEDEKKIILNEGL